MLQETDCGRRRVSSRASAPDHTPLGLLLREGHQHSRGTLCTWPVPASKPAFILLTEPLVSFVKSRVRGFQVLLHTCTRDRYSWT